MQEGDTDTNEQAQESAVTPEATPQPTTPPAAAETPPSAATVDWSAALNGVDPKALRSHPRVAGIIGSEIQTAIARAKAEVLDEQGRQAATAAEQRLRELARTDPIAFAEQYLTTAQQTDLQRQMQTLHAQTREEFAKNIGRGYQALPEMAELSPDELGQLKTALEGVPEDDVIVRFNASLMDLLANRRAQKLHEEWKKKDLSKESEALRKEEAAKLLQAQATPDMASPKGLPVVDVRSMSDKEFNDYWEKKIRNRG